MLFRSLAVDTRKGIASSEEVRNRQGSPDSSPVTVEPVARAEWIETLEAATSLAELQKAWEGAGADGVTRDPKIIAAKDARKAALNANP